MLTINNEIIEVVVTDDHVVYRAGLKASLSFKKDIKLVGEAEHGASLLNLLQTSKCDVILLDIQMPVMDGIATLPQVKILYPHIKIIMLSMIDDQSMITKCMELGANSYLTKTSDPDIIYQAIKTCHEHQYYHNAFTGKSLYNFS